jgi:sulfur-carrier protein
MPRKLRFALLLSRNIGNSNSIDTYELENDERGFVFMVLEVRLYATLRSYAPSSPSGVVTVDLPDGSTVLDLAKKFEIDPEEIHLIMINGIGSEFDRVLIDGDRVGFFPPVGGG